MGGSGWEIMTEDEWLNAAGPQAIVPAVVGQSARKRRLWAIACVRRLTARWNGFGDCYAAALDAGDGYADDPSHRAAVVAVRRRVAAERRELEAHHPDEFPYHYTCTCWAAWLALDPTGVDLAGVAVRASDATHDLYERGEWEAEGRVFGSLAHCVFGNPFHPAAFDPRWRSADVLALARGVYDDRAFDRLPILADALIDAGCEDADILAHCQSEGAHVRGCWVVDLVLALE